MVALTALTVAAAMAQLARAIMADPLPPVFDATNERDACEPSIVLVGVDGSRVSRLIDRVTGRGGFSHVYVDPCRVDAKSGAPLILDYTVARGVHYTTVDAYADRYRVRIELDSRTAHQLWGCVRTRVGKPLRVAPLIAGRDTAASCVGLVVACMPAELRTKLEAVRVGPCISPNTLARFFNIKGPQ